MAGPVSDDALVPLPRRGRIFEGRARAGLGDVSPAGRARLDTLARWLQDVAFDDISDAGLGATGCGSCAGRAWSCVASRRCASP
jgi:hypothetical protein